MYMSKRTVKYSATGIATIMQVILFTKFKMTK